MRKLRALALIILLLAFLLAGYAYTQIPGNKVASHWNARGEVDAYMDKFWGVFLFPMMAVPLYLFFLVIPKIDPLKKNIQKFRYYYDLFIVIFLLFFLYIQGLTIAWNLGMSYDMNLAILPAIAALFYYLSILMKKAERNWFIGIRTPWTLSDDVVWRKTHDAGSKWFKLLAIWFVLLLFFETTLADYFFWLVVAPLIGVVLGLVVYSYWLYAKTEKVHLVR